MLTKLITLQNNTPFIELCKMPYATYNISSKKIELLKIFINAGADVNQSSHNYYSLGDTPLIFIANSFHEGIDITPCLEILMNAGADINQSNKEDTTALDIAEINNDKKSIEFLKKHGAIDKNWFEKIYKKYLQPTIRNS